MRKLSFLLLLLLCFSYSVHSQDINNKIKFSGTFFGDYFYYLSNADSSNKNMNGFQFRKIFVTADFYVAEKFDGRFRLEGNQNTDSLKNGEKIGMHVKNASLKWKSIFTGSDLVFGLSPTPAWQVSQEAWKYRSIEKTIMDLFNISSSRDLGIDLKGKLTSSGTINYWVKFGNNSGQSIETDKYKKFYAMIHFKPDSNFQATFYCDYSSKTNKLDNIGHLYKSNNEAVACLFLNYKESDLFSVGVESFYVFQQNNFSKSTIDPLENQHGYGISLWTWALISNKFRLVARYDCYDPNTQIDNDAITFFVAGLDYKVNRSVSVIPHMELFNYQSRAEKDLIARLTLSYQF